MTLPEALPFVIEPPLMLSPTSPPTPPPPLTLAVADKPLIAVLFWPISPPTNEFVPPVTLPFADDVPLIVADENEASWKPTSRDEPAPPVMLPVANEDVMGARLCPTKTANIGERAAGQSAARARAGDGAVVEADEAAHRAGSARTPRQTRTSW